MCIAQISNGYECTRCIQLGKINMPKYAKIRIFKSYVGELGLENPQLAVALEQYQ